MRFWFHYNKPASSRAGHPVLSLHYRGACHLVRNIRCRVPVEGRIRKIQPRFVLAGCATTITLTDDGIATIL